MNFDRINPVLQFDGNAMLTSIGDVSLCFKINLPEVNTVPVAKYNSIHSSLVHLFMILPENVCLHRQEIFVEKGWDANSLFTEDDFFSSSMNSHFADRTYLTHDSYLYITMLDGFGFKRSLSNIPFFKKKGNKETFEEKARDFKSKCAKAMISLSEDLNVRELEEEELKVLVERHFNGYQDNVVSSPFFKPEFKIGRKVFSVYGLDEDSHQKDGDIDIAVVNQKMSSEISKMYASYMAGFGHELGLEHVVNSFIYCDNQAALKKELDSNRAKLSGIRFLGRENMENARRIDEFLTLVEQEDVKIVRSHFNVTVFDEDAKELAKKERSVQGVFGKAGMIAKEYNSLDYPYIFLANTPGCGGHLPKEYTFLSFTEIGVIYGLYEGNHVLSDDRGIYYCNRTDNIPFLLDTFFEPYESKLVDNRNYFVIAPSGGGKSFASRSRQYQQYKMGFDQVVVNIGGDQKMARLINSNKEGEALYITYEDGETLPINPFFIEDFLNNDKLEFLIQFVGLLWGNVDEIGANQKSILNKIIVNYYRIGSGTRYGKKGYKFENKIGELSIVTFYKYLTENRETIKDFYEGDESMFNLTSLIVNLEKFAIGSYSTLFYRDKPDIFQKRKYIEFELDNIKDHEFLFPIFSMLISDITFNTMWASEGYKDFFIDEAWKILEKPGMALLLKYLYKTIRKFDGAVGIAVQQITDLIGDIVIEKAILGNCSIKYILNHKNVLEQVPMLKEKLSLKESDVAMILSIQNKLKPDFKGDKVRYTEQLIIMGSEFSKIVRSEVSPELAVIYDSKKKRLKKFNRIYDELEGDIEKTVVKYLSA